jgi:hypothetical protein
MATAFFLKTSHKKFLAFLAFLSNSRRFNQSFTMIGLYPITVNTAVGVLVTTPPLQKEQQPHQNIITTTTTEKKQYIMPLTMMPIQKWLQWQWVLLDYALELNSPVVSIQQPTCGFFPWSHEGAFHEVMSTMRVAQNVLVWRRFSIV